MPREILPNPRPNETQEFERDGIRVTMTIGFYQDGRPGEIFLNANHANSTIDVLLHDAAIGFSFALQHGATLQDLAHAMKRDKFGIAASLLGAALDRVTPREAVNAAK